MIIVQTPSRHRHPLEVLRDGHLIYTFGYSGSGPMLECIESLGPRLEGSCVHSSDVDLTCARLILGSGVRSLEADRITPRALQVLSEAGVEVRAGSLVEGNDHRDVDDGEDHAEFFRRLRVSRGRLELTWTS